MAQSFHSNPGAQRPARKQQKQEDVFRYSEDVSEATRSALALNPTAVILARGGTTKPTRQQFVEPIHGCNDYIPTEK